MQAIRDGVVDAVLDHDAGAMVSVERTGVYGTREPTDAFHRRIAFCLDVYNEAVKVRHGCRGGWGGRAGAQHCGIAITNNHYNHDHQS